MKNMSKVFGMMCLGLLLASATASAATMYASSWYGDMTIDDGIADANYFSADGQGRAFREDGENEDGSSPSAAYDLEGFFGGYASDGSWSGETLMVGTYDFDSNALYPAGDIFFDGDLNSLPVPLNTNFELAARINFGVANVSGDETLDFYTFAEGTAHLGVQFPSLSSANPWRMNLAGNPNAYTYVTSIGAKYDEAGSVTGLNSPAAQHNVLSFDLSDLFVTHYGGSLPLDMLMHFTMKCGNDVLAGQVSTLETPNIPEPASLALLGLGVVGLALRRRFVA